jgi:20S proteasome subunit beta 7
MCHLFFSLPRNPTVTGTSVIGIAFDKGVIIAADSLGSYGSMAKLRNVQRIHKVNDSTVIGGHGDFADFQFLLDIIEAKV